MMETDFSLDYVRLGSEYLDGPSSSYLTKSYQWLKKRIIYFSNLYPLYTSTFEFCLEFYHRKLLIIKLRLNNNLAS